MNTEPEVVTAIKEVVGTRRVDALVEQLVKSAELQESGYNKAAKRFGGKAQDLVRDIFVAATQGGLLDKQDFRDAEHDDDISTAEAVQELFSEWLEDQVVQRLQLRTAGSGSNFGRVS